MSGTGLDLLGSAALLVVSRVDEAESPCNIIVCDSSCYGIVKFVHVHTGMWARYWYPECSTVLVLVSQCHPFLL